MGTDTHYGSIYMGFHSKPAQMGAPTSLWVDSYVVSFQSSPNGGFLCVRDRSRRTTKYVRYLLSRGAFVSTRQLMLVPRDNVLK